MLHSETLCYVEVYCTLAKRKCSNNFYFYDGHSNCLYHAGNLGKNLQLAFNIKDLILTLPIHYATHILYYYTDTVLKQLKLFKQGTVLFQNYFLFITHNFDRIVWWSRSWQNCSHYGTD